MARNWWIRDSLRTRRHIDRKTAARSRLTLEALEDRTTPASVGLSDPEVYVEDTPLNLGNIVVSDSVNANATLTLSAPAAGSLSTATSGAVTSTFDPNTGVWSASGPIADVNALLAGVVFTPSPDYNADFSIATSV